MSILPEEYDHKPKKEGLKMSVAAFMSYCSVKASKASRKLKLKLFKSSKLASMAKTKRLLASISHKKNNVVAVNKEYEELEWGDGGVWQKAILMGDKCEPLDFSGVIYYDSNGKQRNEPPMKSPKASSVPEGAKK